MKQEHEMTPGVLVSGEVLSAGDARARVAVLEAEVAELRKRVCVPEGWTHDKPVVPGAYWVRGNGLEEAALVVVKPVDNDLWCNLHVRTTEPDFYYGYAVAQLDGSFEWLGPLAAAPAPVERNQCDGCQAGIPVESGMHRMGKPGGYADLMACTADRYGSAPVERVEPKTGVLVGEPEIVGERCADGGTCHHGCTDDCWRKTGCGPLTCSGLNDDWSAPPAGFSVYRCPNCAASMQIATPQPAPTAAQDVAGLFSTNGNENNWPRIGETYLVRLNGVLQKETFEFDQSDDGIGGGEYFWSRPDCDECPTFDPERDEWLAIATLAAHQSGGAN